MEIWKPCPRWPKHEISNLGRVRSVVFGEPRIMRLKITTNGYLSTTDRLVHRLVAEAFLPPAPRRPWVNHKDGDKQNNRDTNLEWSTPTQNNRHADARGVRHAMNNPRRAHKLTPEIVEAIRAEHKATGRTKSIASHHGVSATMVRRIVYGRSWLTK